MKENPGSSSESANQKVYHVTANELKAMFDNLRENDRPDHNKKRKLSPLSDDPLPTDGPALGAFGAIKNRSYQRLLKSGLNRTYNDLVVHDLVLRGSERIKLLELTPSEFSQAVIKTVLGTLPPLTQNKHTENLLNYFSALFRDTKDDSFNITLRAHKTVMGQLKKGELSLESDWQSWDEVRKHSVLTQTLQSLTSFSNKRNCINNKDNVRNGSAKDSNKWHFCQTLFVF